MPQVFDLAAAMNGLSGATKGFEDSMSADVNRDYMSALTERVKSETLRAENEALRNERRMTGLQKAAEWATKWMGRDRVDTSRGLNPEALEKIAGVARRGPLAFGAAYGQEWARELNVVQQKKQREAEQIAAQMDPRDARAFLADQQAERMAEVEFAAKDAVKRGLARFVANASRVGFDEGALDTAEQMAELLDAGAIDVGTAEQYLFQQMDALATERANLRATERTVQRIDAMGAESPNPKWYEDLAADVESGFLTPDEGYRMAREKQAGLDGTITVTLPGIKQPVQSRTELFRGNGRSSATMPKSARAEAFLLAGDMAQNESGFENLSLEEREQSIAKKASLLLQMGGWEIDETDRAMLEDAGKSGGSWEGLPPQRQAYARKALIDAARGGVTEQEFRDLLEGLGIDPADVPVELQGEIAEAWKKGGKTVKNKLEGARQSRIPGAGDMPPVTGGERAQQGFFDQAGIQNPPSTLVQPQGAAQPSFPPRAGTARPGTRLDPKKLEELMKALKGGR